MTITSGTDEVSGSSEDFSHLVRDGDVHSSAYTDPNVYRAEMDRIFRRTWTYLAHESQVAQSGDYITTRIGSEPVIVSRGDDGQIHGSLNRCVHRAATVCHMPQGNAQNFRCQYHGWTYRNSGEVIGVPFPLGYGEKVEEIKEMRLAPVELASYSGFIFGRLEPNDETLEEHLGQAAPYLDAFVEGAPEGLIKVHTPPTRYSCEANWKLTVENLCDGYHPGFVHGGFLKAMIRRNSGGANPFAKEGDSGPTIDLGNGHGLIALSGVRLKREHDPSKEYGDSYLDRALNAPGGPELFARIEAQLGRDEAAAMLEPKNAFNVSIFPNLLLVQTQIRVVFPVAPDRTEIEAYATEWPAAPEEVNMLRLRVQEGFWGPAGMGVPDDLEMFERAQRGLAAASPEWLMIQRGLGREREEEGRLYGLGTDETVLRAFHKEWIRRLSGGGVG